MSVKLATPNLLRDWIDQQPQFLGDEWLQSLEARKQQEASFHDIDRKGGRDLDPGSTPNRRFYEAASIVSRFIDRWIVHWAPGRVALDYACGNGRITRRMAQVGAELAVGIDISAVSVAGAQEEAARRGQRERIRFLQRDCEATGFPDDSFELCLCSGMLHHLDLSRALPELVRIMRAGGRILCAEALAYNPVIQVYRRRTPELRTAWETEHVLSMKEVRFARQWFQVENLRFHLMAAPLATLLPRGLVRRAGLAVGHAIDAVATRIPGLRLWAWQFTFELVKPQGASTPPRATCGPLP